MFDYNGRLSRQPRLFYVLEYFAVPSVNNGIPILSITLSEVLFLYCEIVRTVYGTVRLLYF